MRAVLAGVVVLALAALWGVAPCPAAHARSTVAAAVPQDRTGMALRHQLGGRSYQLAAVHPEPAAGRILQEYLPPGQVLGQQRATTRTVHPRIGRYAVEVFIGQ